ncbi:glycerol-3-phosphate dehydrogenase, partial [bacterium]
MDTFKNIGVIGAGSWGTALSLVLQENGLPVTVWGHDAAAIKRVTAEKENKAYLPGIPLPPELRFTSELEDLKEADLLLLVTPSKAVREVTARLSTLNLKEQTVLLSCTKGVERGSGMRMSEIVTEFFPNNPVAVLSGPSHAEEVARRMPTAVVLGCQDAAIADKLQQAFCTSFFRAYTNGDV